MIVHFEIDDRHDQGNINKWQSNSSSSTACQNSCLKPDRRGMPALHRTSDLAGFLIKETGCYLQSFEESTERVIEPRKS